MELSSSTLSLSSLQRFFVFLLFVTHTPVEARLKVIGSAAPITAALGDTVTLPCHVEPQHNVEGLTVEWSRPDLRPDPNDRLHRVEYVHVYRDTREDQDMKIASYMRRTALFADGLRQGNISLQISNVTLEDNGRYKCFIPKLKGQRQFSIVHLVVEPNSPKTTTDTPTLPENLQTPDLTEETDVNGGLSSRSRLIPFVLLCVSLVIFGTCGITIYLTRRSEKHGLIEEPSV